MFPWGAAIGAGASLLGGLFGGGGGGGQQQMEMPDFWSKFGSLDVDGNDIKYNANMPAGFGPMMNLGINKSYNIMKQLPNRTDPYAMWDNPYFGSTLRTLYRPYAWQKEQDDKALMDGLSAKNQLFSSFHALEKDKLNRMQGAQLQAIDDQARMASQQMYQQGFNNSLAMLSALPNTRSSFLQQYYMPAQIGMGQQANMMNLNQANAQLAANQQAQGNQMLGSILPLMGQFMNYGGK